jgi:hypothetical protein
MRITSWDIPRPDAGFHSVTVDRGENGKDIVRVDNRVATQPLAPEDSLRQILVGEATYLLQRQGDTFELTLVPVATATAMRDSKSATEVRSRARVLWVAMAACVLAMLWYAVGPSYERQAKQRVELMLSEMSAGPGPTDDLAIGIWAKNARTLDALELGWAVGAWPDFRHAKDLYRPFERWKVLDSEQTNNKDVPTAIVTVVIEGRTLRMRVPERRPISWVD